MKKQELFETLRVRILTQDLPPGSGMDEAQFAAEYCVSRTPLREVFHRLAGGGYITLETNRGAAVSSMSLEVMRNFFQTAPMIYAAIARLAAENATTTEVTRLKAVQQKFKRAVKKSDITEMSISNHRFHEEMGEIAASPYLTPSLQRLLIDHTRMSQTFYRTRSAEEKQRVASACDQHDEMIDAISLHQAARCVELTLDHWALSRDRIELYVQPDPLPEDPQEHLSGEYSNRSQRGSNDNAV